MSPTQLKWPIFTFFLISLLTPYQSKAIEASFFEELVEKVGELQLAGSCERYTYALSTLEKLSPKEVTKSRAPFLKIVFGKKRPFWREVQGFVVLENRYLNGHTKVKKNKFFLKGSDESGLEFNYRGFLNEDLKEFKILASSTYHKVNKRGKSEFIFRSCQYSYKL